MLLFSLRDTKRFMSTLFKTTFFSDYEARGIILQTFTRFEISCHYDDGSADAQQDDKPSRFCLWSELSPAVTYLIKGGKPPKLIKIILCLSGEKAQKINENALALFMTIKYENTGVSVLTGTSQKQFSLDKSVDTDWDDYVKRLFSENGFEIVETDE